MADVDDVKMEMGKRDEAATTVKPAQEKSFYQKHKIVIWIVVAIAVFAVAAGIGVGIAKALEDNLEYHRKVWYDGSCPRDRKSCPSGFDHAPLIIVGLDGFVGDLFDRHVAKHIYKMRECGAHTPNMTSMFPLSTYPNYYSMATGLYPDVHGIIDDYVVDEGFDSELENGTDSRDGKNKLKAGRFYNGEPIWATARKKHRNSASILWPGSDVPIKEWLPNYYYTSGGQYMSYTSRVDRVISWLEKGKSSRPDVIMLYFNSTQMYGTYDQRQNELKKVDKAVGRLMGGLTMLKLRDCSNVIVVADWLLGNKTCNPSDFAVEDYVKDIDDYQVTPDWLPSIKRINYTIDSFQSANYPVEYENAETMVEHFTCKNVRVKAYAKNELPVRLHYAASNRIEDVVLIGEEGYSMRTEDNSATTRMEPQICRGVAPQYFFRNLTSRMLFVGNGYAFRHNFTLPSFRNIELYNLMAELMEIDGDPNNGTAGVFRDSLREPKDLNRTLERVSHPFDDPYPSTDDEYDLRINEDETGCYCDEDHGAKNLDEYFRSPKDNIRYFNDERLDLNSGEKTQRQHEHAPFGLPTIFNLTTEQPGNYTMMYNPGYVVVWDNYLKAPKFVSYTLDKKYTAKGSFSAITRCIRQDVRLIDDYEPQCSDFELLGLHNISMGFMINPTLVFTMELQMDALITTNTAPMYTDFEKGIWKFLNEKYIEWADEYNGINIIVGPVFDSNHDGKLDKHEDLADSSYWIGDTPMPTHFFVILTRCEEGQELTQFCDTERREIMSFVLPNVNTIHACTTNDDEAKYEYIRSHFASIHDIEELTGLRFFPNLQFEEHLRLQMRTPELFWRDRLFRDDPWE